MKVVQNVSMSLTLAACLLAAASSPALAQTPKVVATQKDVAYIVPIEHARNMNERLKSVGVKTELVIIAGANHGVAGAGPQVAERATTFVQEQLLRP